MTRFLLPVALGLMALGAQAAMDEASRASLEAALASGLRSDAEKARDANRKPIETLEFFGFRDDMQVLELFPGTGWYTQVLGPALARRGKLYVALMTDRVRPLIETSPQLGAVEILDVNADMPMTAVRGVFELKELSFFVEDLDLVLTFRNAHNLTPEGRMNLNRAVLETLKPGGLYGVVDHTRRHMEPDRAANRRRTDPVRIIHECEAAGFEFVAFSELHYRPGDDLTLEVGDPAVSGATDRYTLLFRKPQDGD